MTRQIQRQQELEKDLERWVFGVGGTQKHEQTRGGASIGDHVEDGAEFGGLREFTGGPAVQGVEDAGDAVEDCAGQRVDGHVD